jgi:serine/threonine protein kinase
MKKAVIVGIDTYVGAPLSGCVNDAKDIASCLSLDQYDFDSDVLLNSQATRASILRALSEPAYGSTEGDILLFYFAGHGVVLGQGGHLVTHDAQEFDPGISLGQLAQIMESAGGKFRHVISILDCCHSGSAFTWTNSRPLRAGDVERAIPAVNESRCILAACRPEGRAKEIKKRGVFTNAVTDALLGAAVNWAGDVTLLAIADYVAGSLPPKLQTPVFKGDVAGTVVLGSGFPAPKGPPIATSELTRTLAKAHHLVDDYHYLQLGELSERVVRLRNGSQRCSSKLESLVLWFEETEKALPDLRRNSDWEVLGIRVRDFRKNIAAVSVGESTRYGRIVRRIGQGGYGSVWELQAEDGKAYALKLFHGNELDEDVKVRRFVNGYHNMKKLDHPRIVRVREMLMAPFGFLMDYIPGDNLSHAHIDRRDSEGVLRLLIDIGGTIRYAHSQGVRHRDIKPDNIIVGYDTEGRQVPYLTDFDLAYHETNRTVTGNAAVGGVISYAAPEQLHTPNGKGARSETVDVFSLAQLMFFVITGQPPSGEDFVRNAVLIRQESRLWFDNPVADELTRLYQRATAKDPEERWPRDVAAFTAVLEHAELLCLPSATWTSGEEILYHRIARGYAGSNRYTVAPDGCRLQSSSGHLDVTVRLLSVDALGRGLLEIECSVAVGSTMGGLVTAKQRQTVDARLRHRIKGMGSIRIIRGGHGDCLASLSVGAVTPDAAGVERVIGVIRSTVTCIEHR